MNNLSLPKIFDQYQDDIISYTKSFYKELNDDLYTTHKYFLGWIDESGLESNSSGKSFRPSLMMLINESLGGQKNNILPLAMSIELFHNFSLIHDDIEDRDEIRRNRKTVWKIWGEPKGIISGNSMHSLASEAINLLPESLNEKKVFLRKLINRTCLSVIEGQYLDISFEDTFEIRVENYLEMISKKTGALIETSSILGCSLEKTSIENISLFTKLGKLFGQIFQIKDDYLGIWGDQTLGKPIGSDIIKKKKSLPILHLIQSSKERDKKTINNIFSQKIIDEKSKKIILDLMQMYDVNSYCQEILESKFIICKEIIDKLDISGVYKKDLHNINTFLMYRKL